LRVLCARVGVTEARSAIFEVDVAFDGACVERTLLSVAFDLDLDFDCTNQMGVPHLSRLLRKVGTTDARSAVLEVGAAFAFDSDFACLGGTNREGHDVQSLSLP
jgi:hypothetical protein